MATNLEVLQEKIGRIHSLINDPEPGCHTWHLAVHQSMKDLEDWWNDRGEYAKAGS